MSLEVYIAFTLACLVIVLVPGPTVTLIIASSMRHGTRAGLLNVAGTQVGVASHDRHRRHRPHLDDGGDGPLVRMGAAARGGLSDLYRLADARREGKLEAAEAPPAPRGGFFLQGLLVAVSNPKTLFFFGAFFPQFIDPPRQLRAADHHHGGDGHGAARPCRTATYAVLARPRRPRAFGQPA